MLGLWSRQLGGECGEITIAIEVNAGSSDELLINVHSGEQLSNPLMHGDDINSNLLTTRVQWSLQPKLGDPYIPPYSLRPRFTLPSNVVPTAIVEEPISEVGRCRKSTTKK